MRKCVRFSWCLVVDRSAAKIMQSRRWRFARSCRAVATARRTVVFCDSQCERRSRPGTTIESFDFLFFIGLILAENSPFGNIFLIGYSGSTRYIGPKRPRGP